MKKHRGKRRKKAKSSLHAKESSNEACEIDPVREKVKEMKPSDLQFNLVYEDHYSLYERTTVREETRKENVASEFSLENDLGDETTSVFKGQRKSALPPLKERPQRRRRLTFEEKIRASKNSTFDQEKPEDERDDMTENIDPTSSEGHKKLASLSFVGIYDLDDMGKTETKRRNKLNGILKSSQQRVDVEISREENVEEKVEKPDDLRARSYVIQTLTLEGPSPLSNRTLFQDKFVLPGINQNCLTTRSNKIFDDIHKTSQRRERQYRERKNLLPNIVHGANTTHRSSYRRKIRAHHNSFEQGYFDQNIPRLPVIVNGKMTES